MVIQVRDDQLVIAHISPPVFAVVAAGCRHGGKTAPEKMQHLEVYLKSPTQTYVSF